MSNTLRPQKPSNPDNWLHNGLQGYDRIFSKLVYLGVNAPEWEECTQTEKISWEALNPPPEPIEPAEESTEL